MNLEKNSKTKFFILMFVAGLSMALAPNLYPLSKAQKTRIKNTSAVKAYHISSVYKSYNEQRFWKRLRSDFKLKYNVNNPRVQKYIKQYARNKAFLKQVTARAQPYLYLIVDELEKRNMPGELALLPIVESRYNPHATSPVAAKGLWQIMPGTARYLGLKRNKWYDGRQDIIASTNAALDYLDYLQDAFHEDYLLALAGYNSGPGNVSKAIRRNKRANKPTDFWSLRLPKETQDYVPKFIALVEIFSHPDKYNVTLSPVYNEPVLEAVNMDPSISITQAAKMAGLSKKELSHFNPGYYSWVNRLPQPYTLLVPKDKADELKDNLSQLERST